MSQRDDLNAPPVTRVIATAKNYTVALYVLTGIAPLVSIALVSATGTEFAVSFYVLAMVVLTLVALAVGRRTTLTDLPDEEVRR
jgi:hypothetical protein